MPETSVILIKRYENRKLYDTSRSVYVTLEEIAGLIREGKEIRVIDAKTNEDITKSTLALIILEEERQKKNVLPMSLMYQLIKYGELVQGTFQEYLSTGFEALLAGQVEAQKRMQDWAKATTPPSERPPASSGSAAPPTAGAAVSLEDEVAELKQRLRELERRLKSRPRR